MKSFRNRTVKLGLFITIVLAGFFIAIYYIGQQENLFNKGTILYTEFKDIKGLNRGSNIRFSGINVGTVSGITVMNDTTVRVQLAIEDQYVKFISKDSKVEISSAGLMGSKIIIIHHGTPGSPPVEENDVLVSEVSINPEDILIEATNIMEILKDASMNFHFVSQYIKDGKGNAGRIIYDTTMISNIDRTVENLAATTEYVRNSTASVDTIMSYIKRGEGDLGSFIYSDSLTTKINHSINRLNGAMVNIQGITNNLEQATAMINEGEGFMNSLLYDTTMFRTIDTTLINLNSSIDEITQTAKAIERSWIINLFQERMKQRRAEEEQQNQTEEQENMQE